MRVSGKVAPEIENPAPVRVAELIVTAAAPAEVNVTVCVAEEFTGTFPKVTLLVLTVKAGVAVCAWMLKVTDAPPALAVKVDVCGVVTALTVALNVAVVAPSATVTEEGTVTAALLLVKATEVPPLGAAVLSVTVQASVPGPTTEALAQVNALATGVALAVPVPLKLITEVALPVALLVIVSCPVADPDADGANRTLKVYEPPPAANVIGRLF